MIKKASKFPYTIFLSSVFFTVLSVTACQSDSTVPRMKSSQITVTSTKQLLDLFPEKNYTPEAWKAGIREVPRFYITNINTRWQEASEKMPVITKKGIFFRLLAPLALACNEQILKERERLFASDLKVKADKQWLLQLAQKYKVDVSSGELTAVQLQILKRRVDIIPVSLVLAQAAKESGWGSSRFAVEGNALFGQWDYSGNGMKPNQQRSELGDYGIARFDTPMDSVAGYMLNLNTHRAYKSLRERRQEMRVNNKPIGGYQLAFTLQKYSERGMNYVRAVHNMMRVNNLSPTDQAVLVGDEIIYLVPN